MKISERIELGLLAEAENQKLIIAQDKAIKTRNSRLAVAKRAGITLIEPLTFVPAGRSVDAACKVCGMRPFNYRIAKVIVLAAKCDPEKFGAIVESMDRIGNIRQAHRDFIDAQRDDGLTLQRHPIMRKMKLNTKPSEEVQKAVYTLEGMCAILQTIDIAALNQEKVREWSTRLRKSTSIINKFSRSINEQES